MSQHTEMVNRCAVCMREIPDEQPEHIRGFCSAKCKAISDKEDAPRTTGTGASAVLADEYDDEMPHPLGIRDEGDEQGSTMSEEEVEGMIAGTLSGDADGWIANIRTFEEAAILSSNRGLVLRLEDGSEFQITIVRSR